MVLAFAAAAPSPALALIRLSPDYPPAAWVPASTNNYTASNRPVNFNVDMIVIHDTEGSYASAIAAFQDPNRAGSAHYVISQQGPSPPHIGPAPSAVAENGGVLLSWRGHSCHNPITSYDIVSSPAGISMTLPGTSSSVWIPNLTNGASYTFTVTAHNSEGTATLTS